MVTGKHTVHQARSGRRPPRVTNIQQVSIKPNAAQSEPGQMSLDGAAGIPPYQPGQTQLTRRLHCGPELFVELGLKIRRATNQTTIMGEAQPADITSTCDEIIGLQPITGTDVSNITAFVGEACSKVEVRGSHTDDPEMYKDIAEVQSLNRLFSRPQKIAGIDWTSNSSNPLFVQAIGSKLWQTHGHWPKTSGSYAVRAKTKFKIIVSGSPMDAGRIRLTFCPLVWKDVPWSLAQKTQMPGVDINLAEATSAELLVPFISDVNWFYTNSTTGQLGFFYVDQLTPLQQMPGSTPVSISIYWWLEDVELIGAFPPTLAAANVDAQKAILNALHDQSFYTSESRAMGDKLSDIVGTVATLAAQMSRYIPIIPAGLNMGLRSAAGVLKYFGYAKPTVNRPVERVINSTNTYQHNMDGPTVALNLGATVGTKLIPTILAGTDQDEMSLGYLLSISSQQGVGSFSTSTNRDAALYTLDLTPRTMSGSDLSGTVQGTTPLSFVAGFFRQYRGSIEVTIEFSKSALHSGRVVIGFLPFNQGQVNLPSTSLTNDYLSQILDLRTSVRTQFVCPFQAPTAYLDTSESMGTFFIICLDPLRGPDTASPEIDFTVSIRAGTDFEFAIPLGVTPRMSFNPLMTRGLPLVDEVAFNSGTSQFAMECVGNVVMSMKSFLLKASLYTTVTVSQRISWIDYVHGNILQPSGAQPASLIAGCYGLWRGGWGLSVIPTAAGSIPVVRYDPSNNITEPLVNLTSELTEVSGAVHALIPYYGKKSRLIVDPVDGFPDGEAVFVSSGPGSSRVYCYASDDYQMGYFRCTPFVWTA